MVLKTIKHILLTGLLFLPVVASAGTPTHFRHGDPKWLMGVLAFCGVVLLVAIGYLSLCLVFSVTKPGLLRRSEKYLKEAFLKNILTGLLVSITYLLFLGMVNQVLLSGRGLRILFSIPILFVLFVHGLVGFTMVAQGLGDKIHSNINSRYMGSTFMAVFAGGTVLILTVLIPFVGPLCFLVVNLLGIGLATRTAMGMRKEGQKKEEVVENVESLTGKEKT